MKQQSLFQSRVLTTVTAIPQSRWDSIFPPIAESYNFFKTLEETSQDQFKTFYITLEEAGRLVCVAPCFVMDYALDTTVDGFIKNALHCLEKSIGKKISLRILICGCTAAEGRIGILDVRRSDIATALLDEMEALAKKERIGLVAFKDFADDTIPVFRPLFRRGLHRIPSYPAVVLDIPHRSFEEYFATLSKATRKDLRRKFQKADALPPLSFEVTGDIAGFLDEAYPLYLNTLGKSDVQFERLTKEFFAAISVNMPAETRFFCWRLNGKLVAFDLCLVHGDTLVDEYIGMDYTVAYDYHLYYVTFRDMVKWCIQNNVKRYESGALNYDPKKRLDFRFVPHTIYMKHRNPVMNIFFGWLGQLIKPENFDPVLKDIQKNNNPMTNIRNNLTLKIILLLLLADGSESVAELFFKKAVLATGIDQMGLQNALLFFFKLSSTPFLWMGVLIYAANFVLWMAVLSRLDLSLAFPISNATYLIVPFFSMIILHEKVSWVRWLGAGLIIIGVTLISQSSEKKPETS